MTISTDTDPDDGRLARQLRFLLEIDRLKTVQRQNILTDSSRRENSAEHSWHLALFALVLSEYSSSATIDLFKVVKLVLIHDIIEIDAGDAFLWDAEAEKLQAAKEQAAAERLFALLPQDQRTEFHNLWEEFEAGETVEASFARALDRTQPTLLHEATGAVVWAQSGISQAQILSKLDVIRSGAPELWPTVLSIVQKAKAEGKLQ